MFVVVNKTFYDTAFNEFYNEQVSMFGTDGFIIQRFRKMVEIKHKCRIQDDRKTFVFENEEDAVFFKLRNGQ